jgi:hypothetical protein
MKYCPSPIIGRRAVYRKQCRDYDTTDLKYVDIVHKGEIVWIGTRGSSNCLHVILLLDDGALRGCEIEHITVESERTGDAYR